MNPESLESTAEIQLLSRTKCGDKTVVTEIYERYFPAIFRFARLQLENTEQAEDVASEVFFKLIDTMGSHRGPQSSLRGWLFHVARNEVYKHYGKVKRFPVEHLEEWLSFPSEGNLEVELIQSMDREKTMRALKMLAPEQLEVLLLRFGEALSLAETAAVMGKSTAAIKSLQFRAVNTLRQMIGESKGETALENYG